MRMKWLIIGLVSILLAYLAAIRLALLIPAELVPVGPEQLGWVLTPLLFFGVLGLIVLWQLRQHARQPESGSEPD